MKKWIKNNIAVERNYNKIISKGFITIIIYLCISIIWILYSDWIVESLTNDLKTLNRIQSFKGIAFVVITSIFMFFIMNRYNKILSNLNEAYIKSEIKRKEISIDNQKNELYVVLTSYLTEDFDSSEQMVIKVFKYLFNRIEASDLASVFTVNEDVITFVDCFGYDLDVLNDMKFPAEKMELLSFGIRKNKRAEKDVRQKLGTDKYAIYNKSNPVIHESIYIGVVDADNRKYSFSMDISEKKYAATKAVFSEEVVKELKDVQFLLTAMFRIKDMVGMKNMIQSDIVVSFISALEYHDEYTKGHSVEVANIADGIGKEMNLLPEDVDELHWASLIHDLGKIVIPNEILNKPGRLSEEEYELVKQHSVNGESFLKKSESLNDIAKYVRHHHERYDGNGYPDGLKGEEIPLLSRIITLADSYHAMTSSRPYKKALSHDKALQELINNDRKQFCPIVLEAFLRMNDKLD